MTILTDLKTFYSAAGVSEEVQTLTALALLSSIVGRAYNIDGQGLNIYTMTCTDTAKAEMLNMHNMKLVASIKGFEKIFCKALTDKKRIGAALAASYSVLNLTDLKELKLTSHAQKEEIRRIYRELYNVSGESGAYILKAWGLSYSLKSPSFSCLIHAADKELYSYVAACYTQDELVVKFSLAKDTAAPAAFNTVVQAVNPTLLSGLVELMKSADMLNSKSVALHVKYIPGTKEALEAMVESLPNVNEIYGYVYMQKAKRLAAIMAVSDDMLAPAITMQHIEKVRLLMLNELDIYQTTRFAKSTVFTGEEFNAALKQKEKIMELFSFYNNSGFERIKSSVIDRKLHAHGIIPMQYLSDRLVANKLFKHDARGGSHALKESISDLVDEGLIRCLTLAECRNKVGLNSRSGNFYCIVEKYQGSNNESF